MLKFPTLTTPTLLPSIFYCRKRPRARAILLEFSLKFLKWNLNFDLKLRTCGGNKASHFTSVTPDPPCSIIQALISIRLEWELNFTFIGHTCIGQLVSCRTFVPDIWDVRNLILKMYSSFGSKFVESDFIICARIEVSIDKDRSNFKTNALIALYYNNIPSK